MPVIEAWRRRRAARRSSAERRSGPGGGGARGARARRARHAARPGLGSGRLRDRGCARRRAAPGPSSCSAPRLRRRDGPRPPACGWSVPDEAPELDLALDGADEVMRDLAVLKGGGGALLREKLVFACARRRVIVAEARKLVGRLGEGWRLPVEVVRFGWEGTRLRLLELLADAQRAQCGRRHALRDRRGASHPGLRDPARVRSARARCRHQGDDGRGRARPLPRARRRRPAGRSRRLAAATGQVVNCTGCRPSMCGPISSLTTRRCSG